MLSRYLLNIGLAVSPALARPRIVRPRVALRALRRILADTYGQAATVVAHAVHRSTTEPTLVVEIRAAVSSVVTADALARRVSAALRQEAVAICSLLPSGRLCWGRIVGHTDLALCWGQFDPQFFLLIDGRSAAALQEAA